jgi:hypothetical protein
MFPLQVVLHDTKHLDKSIAYSFLRPWLGEGLLTGTGTALSIVLFINIF